MPLTTNWDGLDRATPESKGVASSAILSFLEEAKALGVTLNSLMLYRQDALISEGWWYPYTPELPHMMHSATKSFTCVAVGLAIQEGYFSLKDTVLSFFPEYAPANPSPNLRAMTVEHLLTQTSGHIVGLSGGSWRGIKTSWIEEFFKVPVAKAPGTHFQYSSATSYMLSAIVQRTTGQSTLNYLRPRMLQPMGIQNLQWESGPDGVNPGGNGIKCRTVDLLKLAILFLNKGMWKGQQLLDRDFALAACKPQNGNSYGYQWWIGPQPGSYYAYGLFGQFAVVLPEYEAVLVTTASEPWDEEVLRALIWRRLPGLFNSRTDQSSGERLGVYLSNLRVLGDVPTSCVSQHDTSGRLCVAEANIDGIDAFSLTTRGRKATFQLWDHRGLHRVDVGLQSWLHGETSMTCAPLHHGYQTDTMLVVAGGWWSASDVFEMLWQFPESAWQDHVVIRVTNEAALLERGSNVNSFASQRPPIAARVLSLAGSDGLNVKHRVHETRRSTDFDALDVPTRTVPLSIVRTSMGELLDRKDTLEILQEFLPGELFKSSRLRVARPFALERLRRRTTAFTEFAVLSDVTLEAMDKRLRELPLDGRRGLQQLETGRVKL
jgi:hypothetical protein